MDALGESVILRHWCMCVLIVLPLKRVPSSFINKQAENKILFTEKNGEQRLTPRNHPTKGYFIHQEDKGQ